jgi:hypothetical protein
MKTGFAFVVPALLFGSMALVQSNQPAQTQRPAVPPSPIVQPDGRVTFNPLSPKASSVIVDGDHRIADNFHSGRRTTAMSKDDKGVWSVTVGPLKPTFTTTYSLSMEFAPSILRMSTSAAIRPRVALRTGSLFPVPARPTT